MRTPKWTAPAIPPIVAALALTGCQSGGGDSAADDDGGSATLAVNYPGFPESWAPGEEMEPGYLRVPYENLVDLDTEGEIHPALAAEWEQTDTELTLRLQEGVEFHDGTPFDAEAVKVNLESVQDSGGQHSGPLQVIESIEVVDEHTVQLNLERPTPSLLTTLASIGNPMASPAAVGDGSIVDHPVGTGPWAYDPEASTESVLTFTLFEDYWDGTDDIGFETIELNAIEDDNTAVGALASGELDVTSAEPQALEGGLADGIETVSYPAIRNNVLFFDRGPGGVFEDADVRRAACYAIDTSELPEVTGDLAPRDQHFAEGEPGYNPDLNSYEHDPDTAEELLDDAGGPDVDGEVLAAPFTETQLQVYASQLEEVGIRMDVQVAPPPQFFSDWANGQYPLGMASNDQMHPYDWYQAWFAEDAPGNPAGVESDELAEAADAAIEADTSEEADELWAEVTGIIADEALTCAHAASEETIAWNADQVEGVEAPDRPWEQNLVDYADLRPAEG